MNDIDYLFPCVIFKPLKILFTCIRHLKRLFKIACINPQMAIIRRGIYNITQEIPTLLHNLTLTKGATFKRIIIIIQIIVIIIIIFIIIISHHYKFLDTVVSLWSPNHSPFSALSGERRQAVTAG